MRRRHHSPARASSLAHAVERRGRCGVASEELGFDCIEVSVKKLAGSPAMSIDMIWSESDVDLVVLMFFSACLLVFVFFLFLGSESSTCFLDLRDLVFACSFP